LAFRESDPEMVTLTGILVYPSHVVGRPAPQMNHIPFSWTEGPRPGQRKMHSGGVGSVPFDGVFVERFAPLAAGLAFLALPFVEKESTPLPRHVRRGAQLGRRSPVPQVNTAALRRTERSHGGESDGEHRDWSCSWIRSGHWQRHWWPKEKVHKPTYILPQVRGDTSKPLRIPKGTVYRARR
jgi:hypothetical protein